MPCTYFIADLGPCRTPALPALVAAGKSDWPTDQEICHSPFGVRKRLGPRPGCRERWVLRS